MTALRALIVDDELLARQQLRRFLTELPDVTVAGECESGAAAITAIEDGVADVVFLDVQMPNVDGFGVIEALGVEQMPPVVFVTAHAEHALRAFRAHAVDYLLKPLDPSHVAEAVQRVRARAGRMATGLRNLIAERASADPFMRRFIVRREGRLQVVAVERVDWIEADDNDIILHAGPETHRTRATLSSIADRLDPARFARAHRSAIINLERVREIQPWFKGESVAILHDGTRLTIGRAFREGFVRALGG
jgi:two-component system LytT family response regulator